jgi:hypothetical protein
MKIIVLILATTFLGFANESQEKLKIVPCIFAGFPFFYSFQVVGLHLENFSITIFCTQVACIFKHL